MPDRTDVAYFRARAATERELAELSIDPAVAGVHRALADAYADRLGEARPDYDSTDDGTTSDMRQIDERY